MMISIYHHDDLPLYHMSLIIEIHYDYSITGTVLRYSVISVSVVTIYEVAIYRNRDSGIVTKMDSEIMYINYIRV